VRSRTPRARPTRLPAADTPWDWSHHTTYELRLRRLRHRFSYAFVRELYDLTMDGMLAQLDAERREADLVEGVDARRVQWQAPMARTFAALKAQGVGRLSEFVDRVYTRESAEALLAETGLALRDLRATLEYLDQQYLPFQKPLRVLVARTDAGRHARIGLLVPLGLANNLALLDAGRSRAGREALASRTGIPAADLLDLVHRADISRRFCAARAVDAGCRAGYGTLEAYRQADPRPNSGSPVAREMVTFARCAPLVVQDVPCRPLPRLDPAPPRSGACANGCPNCWGGYDCGIRMCLRQNRVPTCAHCSLFPCDGHWQAATIALLAERRARLAADAVVTVQPLPPERPVVVPLPPSASLPAAHRKGLAQVHAILSAFRAGTARTTYAGRHQQKRRQRHVGGTLWSLAAGGTLADEGEGYLSLDKDECSSRRSEFPDPEHAKELDALRLPGVRTEAFYKPPRTPRHRDNAESRLFVDEPHGGIATLKALRWYAGALRRVYGVPSYKGSSQWAGEAYRRFIAADMTELPQ